MNAASALVVALIATGSVVSSAQTDKSTGLKSPPSADSLRGIEERGLRLAQYDFVAWVATDSLVARKAQLQDGDSYVVRPTSDSTWEAVYGRLNAAQDSFLVRYVARQRAANHEQFDIETYSTPRADTGYVLRASRALAVAIRDYGPQTRPFNEAVLERPDGGLFVYLMPAQVRPDIYPLGGDFRYHFAKDGRQLIAKRRLHNSIIEFAGVNAKGDKLVAGSHTAVLDDIPEDTDVFHVLVRHPEIPEYVISKEFLYTISTDGHIRLVGRSRDILDK